MSENQTVQPLVEIHNLNKYYGTPANPIHILKSIDLTIYPNEFTTVMGPSGSGKSTLINVIGLLDQKFEGTYIFKGQPIEEFSDNALSKFRNKEIGFIYQDFHLLENISILDNVGLPLIYSGMTKKQIKKPVEEALKRVGLGDHLNKKPSELSGGQKQRVAIARALINNPSIIIADEPTGALDSKTAETIMNLLYELHAAGGVTILLVTHDPRLMQYATRHLHLLDGRISKDSGIIEQAYRPQEKTALSEVEEEE